MSVVFIEGNDEILVSQEVFRSVDLLVGSGDKSLLVEELTQEKYVADGGVVDIVPLVTALCTPAFLTPKRIVVGRQISFFKKDELAPLLSVLENLIENVDVVLVWERSSRSTAYARVPKVLKDLLKKIGAECISAVPKGKAVQKAIEEKLVVAPVQLDQSAKNKISASYKNDLGGVDALLEVLVSAFGDTTTVRAEDVVPYLGEGSDIPPWELTDVIDRGDIPQALQRLRQSLVVGERHPLQLLAVLHGHYQKALALDGAAVSNSKEAAEILGMKGSTFPAQKALQLCKKLGSERIKRAIGLLADADLQIRGSSALPPITVTEVLVARLAHLSR